MDSVLLQPFAAQLAELARTRKPLELRLLIELTAFGDGPLSLRDLSRRMQASVFHLREARDSLVACGLLTCDPAPRRKAAIWRVLCFQQLLVPEVRVTGWGTPPGPNGAHPVTGWGTPPGPNGAHPVTGRGTPPNGKSAACGADIKETRAPAPVDSIDVKPEIDRLPKPSSTKYDAEQLRAAQSALHSYMLKFGRDPRAKPPDAAITADFLAAAPWSELEDLLFDLSAERKEPGWSYAWFVTVAYQRIHGLTPAQQKAMRAAMRKPPASAPEREMFQQLMDHTNMRGFSR